MMLKAVWDLHAICVVCVTEKEQELETESVHVYVLFESIF